MSLSGTEDRLELHDYARIALQRLPWIVVPVLVLGGLAGFRAYNTDNSYRATAQVLVTPSAAQLSLSDSNQNSNSLQREVSNEISFASGDIVRSLVRERLGYDSSISVTADPGSDILRFASTAGVPEQAAEQANTWADAYVEIKQSQVSASLTAAVGRLAERLTKLEIRLAGAAAGSVEERLAEGEIAAVTAAVTELQIEGELASLGTATVFQLAAPPIRPTNAGLAESAALGSALGLVAGLALALVIDHLDQRIKTPADVGRVGKLEVLGSIPKPTDSERAVPLELLVTQNPDGPTARAFQRCATSVRFAMQAIDAQSLLVTSPNAGEGKTTTSSNLSWAVATSGASVALIDGDLRRPRLHDIYQVDRSPGLGEILNGDNDLDACLLTVESGGIELLMTPAGKEKVLRPRLFQPSVIRRSAGKLEAETDIVIVDAPPVLAVPDAIALGQSVDTVLVTVRHGRTTRDQLSDTVAAIEQAGATVLGVVITWAPTRRGNSANDRYNSDASVRIVPPVVKRRTRAGTMAASPMKSKHHAELAPVKARK